MDSDEGSSAVFRFTTPLDNDFQWYNLYMRQFGTSAYPPPMPKNPSTTTAQYPTQRDVAMLMASEKPVKPVSSTKATGSKSTGFDGDDFDEDDADGGRPPTDSRARASTLDTLADLLEADNLFSPNFFDFLKGPDGTNNELFSVLLSPRSQRMVNERSLTSTPFGKQSLFGESSMFASHATSFAGGRGDDADTLVAAPGSGRGGNPHGLPREVYNLQSEAWTLLLDNRALAWLQREAAEKGKSASMVRLQLLEVATRSSFMQNGRFARSLGQNVEGASAAAAGTLLTQEQSFQRVYESFSPFFAVLSPPAHVKRLRDQYRKAVRAQMAGRRGPVADLVGLPLFSQYATWREAYEHRKVWPCSPFSFFLLHDHSYNFAHVSAIYVLIQVVKAHTHHHGPHCADTSSSAVDLERAGNLLSRARTARHQVAVQRQLCPYRVMEQMTENLIIAFESSEAKNALTMVSQVCRFLTDCALDQETADRFLDRRALMRQAQFKVPGMNVAEDVFGSHRGTGVDDAHGSLDGQDDGGEDATEDLGDLEMLFALRHFGEAEFHALFDLTTWFVDAATANARVPVDPSLCPPPRLLVHPGQVGGMTFVVNELSNSSPAVSSVSVGSTQSRQTMNRPRGGASPGSATSSPRLPAISPSPPLSPRAAATNAASAAGAGGAGGGHHVPREHRYVPGRQQHHRAVGSLAEVFIRFEMRREQLLQAKTTLLASTRSSRVAVAHSSFSVASPTTLVSANRDEASAAAASGVIPSHEDDPHYENSPATSAANLALPQAATPPAEDSAGAAEGNSGLNESTTVLATPLIVLSTYMRLHGAAWLKNLLDRLFNVLRRESVLLYVNRLDLEASTNAFDAGLDTGTSRRSSTGCASPLAHASAHTSAAPAPAGMNVPNLLDGLEARMERLEDLITQDIQYVMNEFLGALHGRRSATRLPQGITTLLTQFCSTVHLHLLRDVLVSANEGSEGRPGSAARRVAEHVYTLKQKRLAAKTVHNDIRGNQGLDHLLLSIEQYRLAKFLLFDAWIIPALNNAVALGYLPDNAPLHLRWNIDAFARYLKILVNAPFTAAKARMAQYSTGASPAPPTSVTPTTSPPPTNLAASAFTTGGSGKSRSSSPSAAARQGERRAGRRASTSASVNTTGGSRKKRAAKELISSPDEIVLPAYITGVYDVSSGALVRLHDPVAAAQDATPVDPGKLDMSGALESSRGVLSGGSPQSSREVSVTLPIMATSRTMMPRYTIHKDYTSMRSVKSRRMRSGGKNFRVMDAAPWESLSPTLQSLNEVLGIVGYDPEDDLAMYQTQRATVGLDENCAMRVLDFFCQRASTEVTSNVVVSEFEVLPSVATGCIEKVFDFVAGKHPLIEHAMNTGVLPSSFSFSPYLAALTGVLLHPMLASQALDNVYHNSPRFYDTLMRPVEDETMLRLVSALVVDQGGAALVDCNALSPLLASQRTETARVGQKTASTAASASSSLATKYDEEMRKLLRCKTFLTTGAHTREPVTGLSYADQIQRMTTHAGPMNPRVILEAGRDRVVQEANIVPTCFDLWWRSMTLAMTVKVITVLVECTSVQSDHFLEWCQQTIEVNKREYRLLMDAFTRNKGGESLSDPSTQQDAEEEGPGAAARRKTVARGQAGNAHGAATGGDAARRATKRGGKIKSKKITPKKSVKATSRSRSSQR